MYSFLIKVEGSNTDYKYYNNGWATDSIETAMQTYKNLLNTYFPKDIKFIKNLQEPQLFVTEYNESNFISINTANISIDGEDFKLTFTLMTDNCIIYDYSDSFKMEMTDFLTDLGLTEINFDPYNGITGKISSVLPNFSFILKPSYLKIYNWVDKKDNYTNGIYTITYIN